MRAAPIIGFHGPNRWLSNMHPCEFTAYLSKPVWQFGIHNFDMREVTCKSSEHLYQAARFANWNHAMQVLDSPTPIAAKGLAKRLLKGGAPLVSSVSNGRSTFIIINDDQRRNECMRLALEAKFRPGSDLSALLCKTDDAEIYELNGHGDRYWGTTAARDGERVLPQGHGENKLGALLMKIRRNLQGTRLLWLVTRKWDNCKMLQRYVVVAMTIDDAINHAPPFLAMKDPSSHIQVQCIGEAEADLRIGDIVLGLTE